MPFDTLPALRPTRAPWNKGRIIGQKRPLLPKHVRSIRVGLEMADNKRDLAVCSTWRSTASSGAAIWFALR